MGPFFIYKSSNDIQYSAQYIIEKDNKVFLIESNNPVKDDDIVKLGENLYDITGNDFYVMVIVDKDTRDIITSYGFFSYCHSLHYYIDDINLYINISLHDLLKDTGITPELDRIGVNEFVRWGFTTGDRTLIKQIKKVPALKTVVFKNHTIETIDSQYTERKSVGDYVDNLRLSLPTPDTKVLIPLSGGFDSTLLAYLIKDYDNKLAVTVGSPVDPTSEFTNANRTASLLHFPQEKIYSDNTWIKSLPAIVGVMEDEMFDPGVFLCYFLVNRIKSLGYVDYTFITGDGADQVLNKNFFGGDIDENPDRRVYDKDFWLKNPKYCLYRIVVKKIEWMLRLNNINYTTPFISKEFYNYSSNTTNTEHKVEYKEFIKSYIPQEISSPLRKKGGLVVEGYFVDNNIYKTFLNILNHPKYRVLFDNRNTINNNLRNVIYRMYIVLFNYIFIEGGSIDKEFNELLNEL